MQIQMKSMILYWVHFLNPQGMLMAKGVAILSGFLKHVHAVVNRFCGSSMDALHQISTKIESGDIQFGIAAGVEDMFSVRWGDQPDFHPDLAEQEYYIGMGETAEILAKEETYLVSNRKNFQLNHTKRH